MVPPEATVRTRVLAAVFLLMFAPFAAHSQAPAQATSVPQPQQSPANPPILILFIGQVTDNSVQRLMAIVTSQISQGVRDITIGISSGGGDTSAAFGAYNSLIALENQNTHTKITMVNMGAVASAAVVIFCAGNERYSLPNASFMIHGNGLDVPPSHLEAMMLKNTLDMVNAMNEQTIRIISSTTKKSRADIEAAVNGQVVLSPQQAKDWNLIQDIKPFPAPPDVKVLSVNVQPEETKIPLQVTSISETD